MEIEYAKFLLEKTRRDYNLIAEEFSRTREKPWEEIRFLFDNYLNPKEKVLDLGCGNGRYFEFFKEKNVDYLGVDNSEKLIEIAKNKYPSGRFQTEDALSLSFPNEFFDKVYSIAVLHHIPSKKLRLRFLKEARRVLKLKGQLILTVWKCHRPKELYLLFKYTILKIFRKSKLDWKDIFKPWGKKIARYYHCFSEKELRDLIEKSGFNLKKIGIVKNKKGNRKNLYLVAEK